MSGGDDKPASQLAARIDSLAARIPLALAIAVLIGAVLRLALEFGYRPVSLTFIDSAAYAQMANDAMFVDPTRAVGYSIFLELVHGISANIERTIELQHILGLLTGIVLYATVRRVGAPVWVALVGAVAVLFSLDQIYFEHTLASEAPFTFLYATTLYAAVRALEPGRPLTGPLTTRALWLLGAGALLGAAIWVRSIGVTLIPFLALWVAIAIPGSGARRAARAALASAPAVALVVLYMVLNNAATGSFGLIQAEGWGLYARTAQFADCSQFTPPEGTEALCETTPSDERAAPDFYAFTDESPAQQEFGDPPNEDGKLGAFGWAALRAQPLDFVDAVGIDFLRYFAPDLNIERPFADAGNQLEISYRVEAIEETVRTAGVNDYYEPVGAIEVTGVGEALADVQAVVRVHAVLLLQAALLTIAGIWAAGGRERAAIVLLGGSALVMLAGTAFVTYAARFALPVSGPLLAAGALGLYALLQRYRSRPQATAHAESG